MTNAIAASGTVFLIVLHVNLYCGIHTSSPSANSAPKLLLNSPERSLTAHLALTAAPAFGKIIQQ
jgi:hypothetical protein